VLLRKPGRGGRAAKEVTGMSQTFRQCGDCGGERLFAQHHDIPGSCPDSADGECPEWFCLGCGSALLAGFVLYPAEPKLISSMPSRVA
jgi:hypothetical protein